MNHDTRVSIHCYAGDKRQVEETLPVHRAHGRPITILSPADSPVVIEGEDCQVGGKRQSIGPDAIERQRLHMKLLLQYPENFFLMNDADSMCISPEIPQYLYDEPDVLWSCLMYISLPDEQAALTAKGHPFVTMHPPYFMSRRTIETLLAAPYKTETRYDGFIDHWIGEAAVNTGLVWKGYPHAYSGPISTLPHCFEDAFVGARHRGTVFFHSVKAPQFWQPLLAARAAYLDDYRPAGDRRPRAEFNTTPGIRDHTLITLTGTDDQLTYLRPEEVPPPPPKPPLRTAPRGPLTRQRNIGRIRA